VVQEPLARSICEYVAVHVRDVARAIMCVMGAPIEQVRGEVFNVGSEKLNTTKQELVELIKKYLPQLSVEYRNTSFTGDMRSIHVSFEKIRKRLQFEVKIDLEEGIKELLWALRHGVIRDPLNGKYRNYPAILV